MKSLSLNFGSRLLLANLLGSATGNLAKITPLQIVWRQIAFTDSEDSMIKKNDLGNGKATFEAPPGIIGFGNLHVSLEDSHADSVLKEIDAYQGFQVKDISWVEDVKKQLRGNS